MSPRVRRVFDAADEGHAVPLDSHSFTARLVLEQLDRNDVDLSGYTLQDDIKGGLIWILRTDLVA